MTSYTIRDFHSLEDYRKCVRLQQEVWGDGFSELAPLSLLKVAQRLGGVAAGAFSADDELLGFVFGLTGVEEGQPVHWSDMLGVRPGIRDGGLGTALKAFQRRKVLAHGVTRMYWTFDPLESRNAYLNFAKLGIVVREYVPDMYGPSDSPLHQGLGTDRFVALWALDSERVEGRLTGRSAPPPFSTLARLPRAFEVEGSEDPARPKRGTGGETPAHGSILVPIPTDIQDVKEAHPSTAAAWRSATRGALARLLADGFEVQELIRGDGLSYYLLTQNETGAS